MANTNKDRKRLSDKQRKRNRKSKGIFTIPLFIFLLLSSLIIIAYNVHRHTYFKVSQVFISGNVITTDEEILNLVGNPVGNSIFTYDVKEGEEKLLEQENIKEADIVKEYPDDIKIEIMEIFPYMEAQYENKTYYVANTGEILQKPENTEKLVKLTSSIDNSEIGQVFTNDQDKLKFIQDLQTYSYANELDELNLENKDDIGIIIKGIQVEFGDLDMTDYKLKLLDSVLKDIDQKGITAKKIDLTKGQSPVVEVEDDSLNEENNN